MAGARIAGQLQKPSRSVDGRWPRCYSRPGPVVPQENRSYSRLGWRPKPSDDIGGDSNTPVRISEGRTGPVWVGRGKTAAGALGRLGMALAANHRGSARSKGEGSCQRLTLDVHERVCVLPQGL
jgi:hypothetical protein